MGLASLHFHLVVPLASRTLATSSLRQQSVEEEERGAFNTTVAPIAEVKLLSFALRSLTSQEWRVLRSNGRTTGTRFKARVPRTLGPRDHPNDAASRRHITMRCHQRRPHPSVMFPRKSLRLTSQRISRKKCGDCTTGSSCISLALIRARNLRFHTSSQFSTKDRRRAK